MTLDEVRNYLREACEKSGGAAPWAKKYKIAHSYVSSVLRGDSTPGKKILKALKIKVSVAYLLPGESIKGVEGFLYRHFSASGDLLYIGATRMIDRRNMQHKYMSHWFHKIKNITVEKYDSIYDAQKAEKKAIAEENPKYNIADRPGYNPRLMAEKRQRKAKRKKRLEQTN
jgi:hypothetical protein